MQYESGMFIESRTMQPHLRQGTTTQVHTWLLGNFVMCPVNASSSSTYEE